jgi:hypothetical protein
MPCGTGGAYKRTAGADEVVDHKRGGSLHLSNEKITRDNTCASSLVGERFADGLSKLIL